MLARHKKSVQARNIFASIAGFGAMILGLWLCGAGDSAQAHGSLVFKGSEGGIVRAVVMTARPPYILYAATSQAGVFKSNDNGSHWESVNHGLPRMDIMTLALDPVSGQTVYAGTRNGLFKTDNAGASWQATGNGLVQEQVKSLIVDARNSKIIYAGTYHGIWKSTDAGARWAAMRNQPPTRDINVLAIAQDPAHSFYVGTAQGLYRSRDGGDSWQPVSKGLMVPGVVTLTLDPKRSQVLYAGTADGAYKSEDGGDNWKSITFKQTNLPVTAILVDPRHTDTVYLGTSFVGGLFKTEDGGKTWTRIRGESFTPSITALMFLPGDTKSILAGTSFHGEIFLSHDAGLNWVDTPGKAALPHLASLSGSADGANLYIAAHESVYQFHAPQGPWERIADPGVGTLLKVVYKGAATPVLWICGTEGVARGERAKGVWTFQRLHQLGKTCVDLAVNKAADKVLAADKTTLWMGPGHWRERHVAKLVEPIERVSLGADGEAWYVLTQHGLWSSADEGANWQPIEKSTDKNFTDITVLGGDKTNVWLASDSDLSRRGKDSKWVNDTQGMFPPGIAVVTAAEDGKNYYTASLTQGRIFKRGAADESWSGSDIEEGLLQLTDLWVDPVHDAVVYAATRDSGLYRSDDAGEHWSAVNAGLPALINAKHATP